MGHILGALGALLVGIIVLGGAAGGMYSAFSKSNIANTEEAVILLRMQIQQFFNGTNYDGLTNDVAMKAGIVPSSLIRGNNMRNAWGGDVTLSSDTSTGQFTIELTQVPQEECTQLARFQADAWAAVTVNGSEVNATDPAGITSTCSGKTNTVAYTAR